MKQHGGILKGQETILLLLLPYKSTWWAEDFRAVTLTDFTTFSLANLRNKKETSPLVLEGHLRFLSWIYSCLLVSTDLFLKIPHVFQFLIEAFPDSCFTLHVKVYSYQNTHHKFLISSIPVSFLTFFFPNSIPLNPQTTTLLLGKENKQSCC